MHVLLAASLLVFNSPGISVLQYDDGVPYTFSFDGKYRGVSFDARDFDGDAVDFSLSYVEYWFFNFGTPPWDTSQFTAEVWAGDLAGPENQLASQQITAVHNSAVYLGFPTPLNVTTEFWCIVNTGLSANGSPSLIGDGAPDGGRSFYSADMASWLPWSTGDYFIRAGGEFSYTSLERTTWASIKGLY